MRRFLAIVFLIFVASPAVTADEAFVDRFLHLDAASWLVADGWSNGDSFLNDWRRSQLGTGRSGLTVTMDRNSASRNGYSSGEIQSRNVYHYGYFEARMTPASGSGLDTGFFTYIGPSQGKPGNEIDVEILGKNTRAVQFTYHVGSEQRATTITLPFDAADQPHVFGFDWQPRYIRWYVDGQMMHEETGNRLPLPSEPQNIIFDLWGSNSFTSWMGRFTWPSHPIIARLQCVAAAPHFTGKPIC
jgi:endo-1,3-1,4-beta-glycanase ExoK